MSAPITTLTITTSEELRALSTALTQFLDNQDDTSEPTAEEAAQVEAAERMLAQLTQVYVALADRSESTTEQLWDELVSLARENAHVTVGAALVDERPWVDCYLASLQCALDDRARKLPGARLQALQLRIDAERESYARAFARYEASLKPAHLRLSFSEGDAVAWRDRNGELQTGTVAHASKRVMVVDNDAGGASFTVRAVGHYYLRGQRAARNAYETRTRLALQSDYQRSSIYVGANAAEACRARINQLGAV